MDLKPVGRSLLYLFTLYITYTPKCLYYIYSTILLYICFSTLPAPFYQNSTRQAPDLYMSICTVASVFQILSRSVLFTIRTYHTLRNTKVVGRGSRGRLVRSSSIPQDSQLLNSPNTTLSQPSKLNPVRPWRLISIDDEIVSFT